MRAALLPASSSGAPILFRFTAALAGILLLRQSSERTVRRQAPNFTEAGGAAPAARAVQVPFEGRSLECCLEGSIVMRNQA
jgi:hypothetical protein